jgi:transcriptional regulator with XRE-family HTH domain
MKHLQLFSRRSAEDLRAGAAALLDEQCRAAGMLQVQIAREVGVSDNTLASWRKNEYPISPRFIKKLQNALQMDAQTAADFELMICPQLDSAWRMRHYDQPEKQAGALLRALRQLTGCSRQELADVLGVSNHTICRWERGDPITKSALDGISRALSLTPERSAELRQLVTPQLAQLTSNPSLDKKKDAGMMLRALRQLSGVSIEQLADTLGFAFRAVQGWEMGEAPIHPDKLSDIRRALKLSDDDYTRLKNLVVPALDPVQRAQMPAEVRAGQMLRAYRQMQGHHQWGFIQCHKLDISQGQLNNWELARQPIASAHDDTLVRALAGSQSRPNSWFDEAQFREALQQTREAFALKRQAMHAAKTAMGNVLPATGLGRAQPLTAPALPASARSR